MSGLRLSTLLLIVFTFQSLPTRAQAPTGEILPDFPPGATVIFTGYQPPPEGEVPIDAVFIKRIDQATEQTVWTLPLQELSVGIVENSEPGKPAAPQPAIGFVVPQLTKGSYEAWCESTNPDVKIQSVRLRIVPRLLAEEGVLRSEPGKEVEVRVRIPLPRVSGKDGTPSNVNVSARLTSRNPEIAQVISDGPQKIGPDGSAAWRVRIQSGGIAELEAAADGFEPAVLNVVGMHGPGATFREAELAYLRTQIANLELSAATAAYKAHSVESDIQSRKPANPGVSANTGGPSKATGDIAGLEQKKEAAQAEARQFLAMTNSAKLLLNQLAAQPQPTSIQETALKPGDVLLVLGSSPVISNAIRLFDGNQLGGSGDYSHASLYVGEINGTRMVAEMWSSGYWITPLSVSTKGARLVDVYRRSGIDDNKRTEIANRGASIFGNPVNFVRRESPSFLTSGSPLPYAHEEITVLGLAALRTPGLLVRAFISNRVDPPAGGRRKMICSELVAWVYEDVGLELGVTYWKALSDANIFVSTDRKRDYTTPNMLARSKDLTFVGRYLGP